MSATIMRFAPAWGRLIPRLKASIAGDSTDVDIKMGVGLNFNRLDDTTSVNKEFGSSRLSWLAWQVGIEPPAGSRTGIPEINEDALRALFTQQLDFLGKSVAGSRFLLVLPRVGSRVNTAS